MHTSLGHIWNEAWAPSTHSHKCAFLGRNRNAASKSIGKHKATSREPTRTSVSSSRTFAPLLTTEGLRILLPKS
jgi:hypothetical protein